jgi:hypothetical protein
MACCDPSQFPDLQPEAAREIAAQINGVPDCTRLTSLGWSWSTALEIQRQIQGGGNAAMLFKLGIPPRTAKAIAAACNACVAEREAALAAQAAPGPNAGKTIPRKRYASGSGFEPWAGERP